MSSSAISIQGLTKNYGDFAAVDGINLEVSYGEIFAILGPNGAGKTTTVEILEGYRSPYSGKIPATLAKRHIRGESASELFSKARVILKI